jgi:CTP:molybdopterin cytidylyltransferase MocA
MSCRIACAILAAGGSQRLGHPKQLVLHRGQPLVRLAAQCAWQSRAAACSVVVGAHANAVRAGLGGLPVEVIHNADWAEGVASSLRAATAWAVESSCEALLLALCDQPHLTAKHLDRLIAEYELGARPVASRYAGKNAVPALFPARYFAYLARLRGDAGASRLLNGGAPVTSVPWSEGEFDVDTPEAERLLTPTQQHPTGLP